MKVTQIRTVPQKGVYFARETLEYGVGNARVERAVVNVYDDIQYQTVLGFGAAVTESSAYNYSLMSDADKKRFLELYYSREKGIGYNFGRTCIGSCDFGLDIYSYVADGDMTLDSFTVERDKKYVLPMLKDILAYCDQEIVLFASPWSPPAYMKDNESYIKGGKLKEECKRLWALYFAKYIQAYAAEGVTISAISVQNEPLAIQTWESCQYSPEDERTFIEHYLAPVLEQEGLGHIKLIIWDHNKERVYDRAKKVFASPAVRDRVWAVGHHWYSGDHYDAPRLVYEQFGKMLISTEICGGIDDDPLLLAERYGREISGNFGGFMGAFCDWNILLDQNGGPFHNRNARDVVVNGVVLETKSSGCHAPILYNTETHQLQVTPIYYYIGHFSKFVQRGACRVATTKFSRKLQVCGFRNPDGSLVVVIQNDDAKELPVNLRHDDVVTQLTVEGHSITTVILEQ